MTTADREQQRNEALELANYVRVANGALCREIAALSLRDGGRRVAQVLREPAGPAGAIPIGRLLLSVDYIGEDKMGQYLRAAGIFSTTKRVRALTHRQRHELALLLEHPRSLFPWSKAA